MIEFQKSKRKNLVNFSGNLGGGGVNQKVNKCYLFCIFFNEGFPKIALYIGKNLARQDTHENLLRDIFFRDWLLSSPTVRMLSSVKGRKPTE